MFACCGSNSFADPRSSKADRGSKDGGTCATQGNNCLGAKGGSHWLSPSRTLKHQVVLLNQDDVELKTAAIVNPARFLSAENPMGNLERDCLLTIEQQTRPERRTPENPDLELLTDGSSFVQGGKRMAGYAVVTTTTPRYWSQGPWRSMPRHRKQNWWL